MFTPYDLDHFNEEKYIEALNDILGVDSAYFSDDESVESIRDLIRIAAIYDAVICAQKLEINRLSVELEEERKKDVHER